MSVQVSLPGGSHFSNSGSGGSGASGASGAVGAVVVELIATATVGMLDPARDEVSADIQSLP